MYTSFFSCPEMLRVVFLLSGIKGCSTRCLKLGSDIEDDVTRCLPACGDL